MNAWKAILAALLIFTAGFVTGDIAARLRSPAPLPIKNSSDRPPQRRWSQEREAFVDKMQRELDLSPVQRSRIEIILAESQQRVKELWDTVSPKARDEYRLSREKILAELTPEQQARYEQVFPPHKNHHDGRSRRSSGPPSGTNAGPSGSPSTNSPPSPNTDPC